MDRQCHEFPQWLPPRESFITSALQGMTNRLPPHLSLATMPLCPNLP
jgi:hypothetical protein